MSAVFDWVKDIVFYLILLTVVTHLIPGKKYEKYVRLFTGMVLIMVVVRPVVQVFSLDEIFDKNFLDSFKREEQTFENEMGEANFLDVQEEQMTTEYERQMNMYADVEARRLGMRVVSFHSEIEQEDDILVPKSIDMTVQAGEANSYEVDTDNQQNDIETVTIPEIILHDSSVQARSQNVSEQARELQQILAEYYGISMEKVSVSVL